MSTYFKALFGLLNRFNSVIQRYPMYERKGEREERERERERERKRERVRQTEKQ